ncbi:hypothetical protein LOD99_13614 [Oopsacas minuta]|uniref:COMM domain-containing protein n=1 Tax=Oopsacas minuta TaxID=111878 RepID=A0AAV7KIZ0_9METZ|nr:hypothetical protein LOD99_13614 [Oopsacas minuta]
MANESPKSTKLKGIFQETEILMSAVSTFNKVDPSKFPLLLSRVLQRYHVDEYKNIFSTEEMVKLEASLSLEKMELELLLDGIKFVVDKAAYFVLKPASLSKELMDIGLEEERATAFSQGWGNLGKALIERLKKRAFFPIQLEDINWRLNLQLGQSFQSRQKIPKAIFQLELSDESKPVEEREQVTVEFSREELYRLYDELEKIQDQLDSLT